MGFKVLWVEVVEQRSTSFRLFCVGLQFGFPGYSRLKGRGEAFRKEGHRVKNSFYKGSFCSLDTGDIQTGSRRRLVRLQPFFKLFIATPSNYPLLSEGLIQPIPYAAHEASIRTSKARP